MRDSGVSVLACVVDDRAFVSCVFLVPLPSSMFRMRPRFVDFEDTVRQ